MRTRAKFRAAVRKTKRRVKERLKPAVAHWMGRRLRKPPLPPEQWGLRYDDAGHLCCGDVDFSNLVSTYGSPLHVVNASKLTDAARRFQVEIGIQSEVYYSYKTNPIPGTLALMHDLGVGAEVISAYELWLALELGVPPNRIIYNGPVKSKESLHLAVERGIRLINLNSAGELDIVEDVVRKLGKQIDVGIRISVDGGWAGQFGVPIGSGEALALFERAKKSREVRLEALHAHRGVQIRSEAELEHFVSSVLRFTNTLRDEAGVHLRTLDLGGSLACPTVKHLSAAQQRLGRTFLIEPDPPDPEACLGIEAYVRRVGRMVRQHYDRAGFVVPRVVFEPGRALTSSSQSLVLTVRDIKPADGFSYVVTDAGINLAECVQHEFHQLFAVNEGKTGPEEVYRLAGPICTAGDVLYNAVRLPRLEPGDTLAIMDAGAYFVPFSTSFSFPQPAVVLVDEVGHRALRRAETYEDLVRRDGAAWRQVHPLPAAALRARPSTRLSGARTAVRGRPGAAAYSRRRRRKATGRAGR